MHFKISPLFLTLLLSASTSAQSSSTAAVVVGGYSLEVDLGALSLRSDSELFGCPGAMESVLLPDYPKKLSWSSGVYTQDKQGRTCCFYGDTSRWNYLYA